MDEQTSGGTTSGATHQTPDQDGSATAPPARTAAPSRRRRVLRTGAVALALAVGAGGVTAAVVVPGRATTSATAAPAGPGGGTQGATGGELGTGGTGGTGGWVPSPRWGSAGGAGGSAGGSTGSSGSTGSATTTATAAQSTGVVTVVSTLGYQGAEAAGTGVVLTADGEVLTNNHVVEGATSIAVTDADGRTWTATVVGTDAADDVAVLHLEGASGLATAAVDADGTSLGEAVTAVGNAGGTGVLVAALGVITAADQSITTQAEGGDAAEQLSGLLETSADVVAGDSGGPLLDADGEVVGIDTAATSGTADATGYAIPIATALAVVAQVRAGTAGDGVVLGLPAFLGVQLSALASPSGGALVAGVVDGAPAAAAGLVAGDTVTAVGGDAVTGADDLTAALAARAPGDRVSVTWTDAAGTSRTADVVLASGPAA